MEKAVAESYPQDNVSSCIVLTSPLSSRVGTHLVGDSGWFVGSTEL